VERHPKLLIPNRPASFANPASRFPQPKNLISEDIPKPRDEGLYIRTEMSHSILLLCDGSEVGRCLRRLIEAQPGWSIAGEMRCENAVAGSPLEPMPDIVIAELNQLDAGLIAVITAVRGAFGGSKLLAVSDHRDSRLVLRIIHAGANGFMITDRAPEELASAIRTIAAGEGRRPR
jgi:DNA-binding NarL/FixJ family response regulator